MEILKIENLFKSYNHKLVLDNINLTILEGEIVGLIGNNGSGKSTLMKIVANLVNADNGKITVCGYDVVTQRENALEQMSVIIEGPSLYPEITVEKQLKINTYLRNLDDDKLTEAYHYLAKNISKKEKINKLSLGMKQEVALAQSFMCHAKLYVLDEPINGLDFDNILKFRDRLLEVKKEKSSVLISSHILKELDIVADRFVFIKDGKIIKQIVKGEKNIEDFYKETINYEKETV